MPFLYFSKEVRLAAGAPLTMQNQNKSKNFPEIKQKRNHAITKKGSVKQQQFHNHRVM